MPKKIVLVGGGAHAFSVLDMLKQDRSKYEVTGYVDKARTSLDLKFLGTDKQFILGSKHDKSKTMLAMCIGSDILLREKLFKYFKDMGYKFLTYAHPSVVVSPSASCGEGSVIFPASVIGPGVNIGRNVCVHSNVVVEHGTDVGDHTYISPSCSIAGDCEIGSSCFLGINSTLIESVTLKTKTVVGAGAVVLESFGTPGVTLVGVPARINKRR